MCGRSSEWWHSLGWRRILEIIRWQLASGLVKCFSVTGMLGEDRSGPECFCFDWPEWGGKKKKKRLSGIEMTKSSNVKFKTEKVVSGTSCFHTVWLLFCCSAVITSVQIHSILLTKWLVKFYKCGNKAKKEQKHKQSGKFSQMKKMKPNSRIVPKLSITADRLTFQPRLIPQILSFCVEPLCVIQTHKGLLCEQRTTIRVRIRRLDVI